MSQSERENLVDRGVRAFARGELEAAVLMWRQAAHGGRESAHASAYLAYLAEVLPELLTWANAVQPNAFADSGDSGLAKPASDQQAGAWQSGQAVNAAGVQAVAPPGERERARVLEEGLRKALGLHDFSSVYNLADELLRLEPEHAEAAQAKQTASQQLLQLYRAKLGDPRAVPELRMAAAEVVWLDLDARAGFVLAQVDGVSSYEEIVDVAAMTPVETYRTLAQLLEQGVVGHR